MHRNWPSRFLVTIKDFNNGNAEIKTSNPCIMIYSVSPFVLVVLIQNKGENRVDLTIQVRDLLLVFFVRVQLCSPC